MPNDERKRAGASRFRTEAGGETVLEAEVFRLLVQSVKDYAIFMMDPTGHIVTWNKGAERIKGYTADQIIGKHFSIFYPPEDNEWGKPGWELKVALEEGRFEDEDWRLRRDGTRFWANVIITALFEDGEHVGFAKVTRDLTERRNAELRAIEDARRVARAEAANKAKGEFLAALSHELRTPLNAIGGYVDILTMGIRGELTPEQLEDLERIRRSQQHLLGIINDLLNFSRIDAGRITYRISPVRLSDVVAGIESMVGPMAAPKGLSLEWPDPSGCAVVLGDRSKVDQILLNLLTNAVKFTSRGGHISVACGTSDGAGLIRVRDDGVGIDPELAESIFEPFVQVGRSLATPHEGTGLGLSISRDLARAMNGDLTVESQPGSGSTFTLSLPLADADPDADAEPDADGGSAETPS